jgi:hypothetical protein
MGAPKKPKVAGVQKKKTKATAAKSATPLTIEPNALEAETDSRVETEAPAPNGNGNGEPIAETIRLRAYEIFMARNGSSGDELSDWLTAEREVMGRVSSTS